MKIRNMSRSDARQVMPQSNNFNVSLVTIHNPAIKHLQISIRYNLPLVYRDTEVKNVFPEGTTIVTYNETKA